MYLIRERFFRSDEHSNITDDQGRPVLQVDAKALSLRNRLVLRDPKGKEVAQVRRTLAAHRPTYEVSVDGQEAPRSASTWSRRSVTASGSIFLARTSWRCAATWLTTSSPSAEATRRWRPSSSVGSPCPTPMSWMSLPARTTCCSWPASSP
jgi:hypothetical protein